MINVTDFKGGLKVARLNERGSQVATHHGIIGQYLQGGLQFNNPIVEITALAGQPAKVRMQRGGIFDFSYCCLPDFSGFLPTALASEHHHLLQCVSGPGIN